MRVAAATAIAPVPPPTPCPAGVPVVVADPAAAPVGCSTTELAPGATVPDPAACVATVLERLGPSVDSEIGAEFLLLFPLFACVPPTAPPTTAPMMIMASITSPMIPVRVLYQGADDLEMALLEEGGSWVYSFEMGTAPFPASMSVFDRAAGGGWTPAPAGRGAGLPSAPCRRLVSSYRRSAS